MKKLRRRQITYNSQPSMTKQSFKDECNINKIMDKFQKSGAINHYAAHAPQYGDCTHIELLDAQLIVANANSMFEDLPSSIRAKFENDPGQFLDFVQDENNSEEMIKLGLKNAPPTQRTVENPTTPPPTNPTTSPEPLLTASEES